MSDSNNHTHLVKFQGKYYLFYHSLGLQDSRDLKVGVRSICVEEIEVDEKDLTIHMGTSRIGTFWSIPTGRPRTTNT